MQPAEHLPASPTVLGRFASDTAPNPSARRWAQLVSYTFAATPIICCTLLYSFILHWRVFHGTWPTTGTKRTTIAIQLAPHESITGGLAMFLIFSFPVWAVFVAFVQHYTLANSRRLAWFFIPCIAVLILAAIDPGHFIRWFFD